MSEVSKTIRSTYHLDNLNIYAMDRQPALPLSVLVELLSYFKPVSGLETCADLQPLEHSRCQNSVETEIIRGITRAYTHTRSAGLSVEDRYEKKALCSLIGSVGCCNPSA